MSDTIKILRIPRDTEARRKGYVAGRRGLSAADNPYELETQDARAWLMGLSAGRLRPLTVVRKGCE